MADLGKIIITNNGDYDESVTYERLTCVRHNSAYWMSTQTTIGNEPLEGSEYWKLVVRDGADAVSIADWAKATVKPTYTAEEVGADESGSAANALTDANAYTDQKISDLNNAIGFKAEQSDLAEVVENLNNEINRATTKEDELEQSIDNLTTHVEDTDVHMTKTDRDDLELAKNHVNSEHARADATKVEASETNGNIKIDDTEVSVYIHPEGTNPHGTTKADLELENVENKSSKDIRGELTKENVTNALGYTPVTETEINNKLTENTTNQNTYTDQKILEETNRATQAESDLQTAINNKQTREFCIINANYYDDGRDTSGWYKVASGTFTDFGNVNVTFMITSTYMKNASGILQLQIRSDKTEIHCNILQWHMRIGFNADDVICVIDRMTYTIYVNNTIVNHGRIVFEVLSKSSIASGECVLELFNSTEPEETAPTPTVVASDGASVLYSASTYTDSELNDTSTNPVQNKVINEKFTSIENDLHFHSNKGILDNTTASYTTEDKTKLDNLNIQASTTDLEDGVSELTTGTVYLVYE